MNGLEKIAYNLVKKNPKIKNLMRNTYQTLMSIVPKKKKVSSFKIIEREGYFFGFHDKVPWSKDETMLLAHKLQNNSLENNYEIEVGYFKGEDNTEFVSIGTTNAWNLQQGSMLQWLNDKNEIIYNVWNGQNNVARIVDIHGHVVKELSAPIGAVSRDGKYALSYSFDRLNYGMVGYGYQSENDSEKQNPISSESGLSIIDIETNKVTRLFSIKEIVDLDYQESMKDGYHFFTHGLFAPSGNRFLFLHRWYKEGKQLFSRMISCDLQGQNIHIFQTNEMVSHISWVNDKQVIAYCNSKEYGDGYHLFEDMSKHFSLVGEKHFTADGHPQHNALNNKIVTDTYPNRFRIQTLMIYDIEHDTKDIIAKLWSPNKYRDNVRCDLHPRWNHKGDKLCFDSAHTSIRSLCTIDLTTKIQ